jgi:hypothetical protein
MLSYNSKLKIVILFLSNNHLLDYFKTFCFANFHVSTPTRITATKQVMSFIVILSDGGKRMENL